MRIPELVQRRMEARLRRCAEEQFAGRYTRLEIRFRGQFCYVDAYTEPLEPSPDWPPAGWHETREEYLERLRNTPTHLCRLRYFGDEEGWGFGFFAYSSEKYELSPSPQAISGAGPRTLSRFRQICTSVEQATTLAEAARPLLDAASDSPTEAGSCGHSVDEMHGASFG